MSFRKGQKIRYSRRQATANRFKVSTVLINKISDEAIIRVPMATLEYKFMHYNIKLNKKLTGIA